MSTVALYVHVPFCRHLCPYCAFYKRPYKDAEADTYLLALDAEVCGLVSAYPSLQLQSIFLGGGTPSALSEVQLLRLFTSLRRFQWRSHAEITIEMNPETVTEGYLEQLYALGVNRLSIGAQSFRRNILLDLGRQHEPDVLHRALSTIQASAFKNFNIDLMFSNTNETLDILTHDLDAALAYTPTHLSAYALSIEPGTLFAREKRQALSSDVECRHYQHIQAHLKQAGFAQYEVSAFAKAGFESRHNLQYWELRPYIGIGPSAASYFQQRFSKNKHDFGAYVADPTCSVIKAGVEQADSEDAQRSAYLLTTLRLIKGFSQADYQDRFGQPFQRQFAATAPRLADDGYLDIGHERVRATDKGLLVLDSVLETLLAA